MISVGEYPFEANEATAAGDSSASSLTAWSSARGGSVTAGKKAPLKADTSGTFVNVATPPGRIRPAARSSSPAPPGSTWT